MKLTVHNPRGIQGRIDLLRELITKSIQDPQMRQIGLAITQPCPWRDDRCELEMIWRFMHNNVRYTGDVHNNDTFQTARRTLQFKGGDCFTMDTKLWVRRRLGIGWVDPHLRSLDQLRHSFMMYEALSFNPHTNKLEFRPITGFVEKDEPKPVQRMLLREPDGTRSEVHATADHKFFHFAAEGLQGGVLPIALAELQDRLLHQAPVGLVQFHGELQTNSTRAATILEIDYVGKATVGCITVAENHNFILENGLLVHNCDDGDVLISTLAMVNGFPVKSRITKNINGGSWAHIYPMVGVPRNNPKTWIPMDWTLGYHRFGVHPPQSAFLEFDARKHQLGVEISPQDYQGWG